LSCGRVDVEPAKNKQVAKAARCIKLLAAKYGKKEWPLSRSVVEHLLYYHLHLTVGAMATKRLIKRLRQEYVDYNEVRVAPRSELGDVCESAKAPRQSAAVIKTVLRSIFKAENTLDLDDVFAPLTAKEIAGRMSKWEGIEEGAAEFVAVILGKLNAVVLNRQTRQVLSRYGVDLSGLTGEDLADLERRRVKVDPLRAYLLLVEHARRFCKDEPRCKHCFLLYECREGKRRKRR